MLLILPVGVDYRARRYPVVTFTAMGLCTVIYLVTLAFWFGDAEATEEWVFWNLWLIPSVSHWWTYLTTMFVHDGFFHLLGNMIYLFLFGACVEDMIGRPRFIALFLLTGLGASLAHIAFSPGHFASEIPLGGASGAISGCIGGFLLLHARTRIEFKWIFLFFFRLFNGEFFLPAWLVISFWFLSDLAAMFLSAGEEGGGVAFAAHVGGTLAGIALMAIQKQFPWHMPDTEVESEPEAVLATPRPYTPQRMRVQTVSGTIDNQKPTLYLFMAGAQSGPFTHRQVERMQLSGEIPADTLYWEEGMEDWRSAEELRVPGT